MPITAAELARRLDGVVVGDGDLLLQRFSPAETAGPGDVTFAENEAYFAKAKAGNASAIILALDAAPDDKTLIRVPNVRVAFAKALEWFFPEPRTEPGIHPSAVVADSAQVDPTASVGPFCCVNAGAKLGPGVVLLGGDHVGEDCALGEGTRLFPNVTLYPRTQVGRRVRIHAGAVIGSDGYGYVFDEGRHRKVPQTGNVIIEDDVEIGANVTIDRGALGPTVVGAGTKIDNLVQVAHNVTVGKHSLLISQAGIAGSTQVGDYTTLAGQVGVAGHLKIGSRVTIGAKSGVMHDIPDGETWLGAPAGPAAEAKRRLIAMQRLPELVRRLKSLEKEVAELRATLASPTGPDTTG